MKYKLPPAINIVSAVILIFGVMLVAFAVKNVMYDISEYAAARDEYSQLREMKARAGGTQSGGLPAPGYAFGDVYGDASGGSLGDAFGDAEGVRFAGKRDRAYAESSVTAPDGVNPLIAGLIPGYANLSAIFDAAMRYSAQADLSDDDPDDGGFAAYFTGINPDFDGWLTVYGVDVDYPVARARNNSTYLKRTFQGRKNAAGSIFTDYRCSEGFNNPVCVVYGHNMKDGSMFASLKRFLNPKFIKENPDISVAAADGSWLVYKIFNARVTHAWDAVYSLDYSESPEAGFFPGAPEDADQFLILSTCVSGRGGDARLLVYAARA